MLGFPILYFKGRRLTMFQLSGFYCTTTPTTTTTAAAAATTATTTTTMLLLLPWQGLR